MYKTNGHKAFENGQWFMIVWVNVKGVQKIAITKSATAKLIRKPLKSLLDLLPHEKTTITKLFPQTAKVVVKI